MKFQRCLNRDGWKSIDVPMSLTSKHLIAAHKKSHENSHFQLQSIRAINTHDYCRVISPRNECWLCPFPLTIGPKFQSCFFFFLSSKLKHQQQLQYIGQFYCQTTGSACGLHKSIRHVTTLKQGQNEDLHQDFLHLHTYTVSLLSEMCFKRTLMKATDQKTSVY